MESTKKHIEALIFAAEQPISMEDIQSTLSECLGLELDLDFLESLIKELQITYAASELPFEIVEIDESFQFLTKSTYHNTIGTYLKQSAGKKLSNAALETLAIIAYKQPVTKPEIESIRGVNCEYLLQKLLERELVHIAGRDESPGRPLLYSTSPKFMSHFGLKSIKDLPKLKEFEAPANKIGQPDALINN